MESLKDFGSRVLERTGLELEYIPWGEKSDACRHIICKSGDLYVVGGDDYPEESDEGPLFSKFLKVWLGEGEPPEGCESRLQKCIRQMKIGALVPREVSDEPVPGYWDGRADYRTGYPTVDARKNTSRSNSPMLPELTGNIEARSETDTGRSSSLDGMTRPAW